LIVVAPQIGLSTLVQFPLDRVKGLVLEKAGRTSHVAIVARSHQIPIVSGIERIRDVIRTGNTLVVDGSQGVVEVLLSQESVEQVRHRVDLAKKQAATLVGDMEPCVTRDDVRIHVYGNTEVSDEVKLVMEFGAEGVGLFRSEYIYLKYGGISVGEEEQFQTYRALAESVAGQPALVRTLDLGVDRDATVAEAGEETAVLGLRGIRLSLRNPDLFRTQIRAILRARRFGNLQIVFPMISSVDEFLQARELVREIEEEMANQEGAHPPILLGVLLEVPGALWTLESLVKHVDFLAVGTNDLIQYTLAAGRLNEEIAHLYNPLHPAVLGSLQRVASVTLRHNLRTFVCGEMAAHPIHSAVLVGMGFRHLSMTPFAIPVIKKMLRGLSVSELEEAVRELLREEVLSEIEQLVTKYFGAREEIHQARTELVPIG
jgi:phosphotransferase system enzyme I (PtsI)